MFPLELISKKRSTSLFSGNQKSHHKGSGIEFSDIREYNAEDSRLIDWKATAKSGNQTYIKNYEEWKELRVFIAVNLQSSLYFGRKDEKTKMEALYDILDEIITACSKENHSLGMYLEDSDTAFIPSKPGNKQRQYIREIFLTHTQKKPSEVDNFQSLLTQLVNHKIKNTLLILLSDSLEIPDTKNWKILTKQNDVVRIHMQNPLEECQIDPEKNPLLHISTRKQGHIFDALNLKNTNYSSLFLEQKHKLAQIHRNSGSDYFEITTEWNYIRKLQYLFMNRKKYGFSHH